MLLFHGQPGVAHPPAFCRAGRGGAQARKESQLWPLPVQQRDRVAPTGRGTSCSYILPIEPNETGESDGGKKRKRVCAEHGYTKQPHSFFLSFAFSLSSPPQTDKNGERKEDKVIHTPSSHLKVRGVAPYDNTQGDQPWNFQNYGPPISRCWSP